MEIMALDVVYGADPGPSCSQVAHHRTDTCDTIEEQSDTLCGSEFLEIQRRVRPLWSRAERCVKLCPEDGQDLGSWRGKRGQAMLREWARGNGWEGVMNEINIGDNDHIYLTEGAQVEIKLTRMR